MFFLDFASVNCRKLDVDLQRYELVLVKPRQARNYPKTKFWPRLK